MGSPSIVAPAKTSRVEVDAGMGDLRVLSAILRGVDVTEVYPPKRVVEVCYKYQLVKGDLFDLRTGFDLSDPRVQESAIHWIEETSAVLVIMC